MRFGSLFSGIGGLDLGLERAGMTCAWQVEIDPYARRVLEKHWPDVERIEDVRSVRGVAACWKGFNHRDTLVECVDLICGGFPCQDISVAGKGAGLAGARSGLWSEYRRIVDEVAPKWVLIENVPALRTRGLRTVLSDLHACGYDAEWDGVSASAVGAPHRRDRLFVVAYARGKSLRLEQGWGSGTHGEGTVVFGCDGQSGAVADTERIFGESRGTGDASEGDCSGTWSVEPDVGGTSDGFPGGLDIPGVDDATKAGAREVLRAVRSPVGSGALQRATRGLGLIQAQEVLFAVVREFEGRGRLPRELVEGASTPEAVLRALRIDGEPARAPLRRGPVEQLFREHPDALRKLSQLVASRGETPWSNPLWESGVSRVRHEVPSRVDRLRCLGNAVVPQVAEYIGRLILNA